MKSKDIGFFAMGVGALGIIIPILVLIGDSSKIIQIGIMISGSIIFGCGCIAAVIAQNKEQ
ncbi:MAG: hypothetical protein QGH42_01920 [Kiritimatiellia bacterium]|jgi:hypothetical protein|nr:hypothetical protein [Kiritimatiellia bacterium]MDP6809255.1 hypothetical protein [Kiritimatiellia bacterium]MDP7022994.1 hypothetical protein [Kiritimatiellia bacterium]